MNSAIRSISIILAIATLHIPNGLPDPWVNTNDIDLFIYQKLEEQNLAASDEASKEKLLRRVYLDLTGLPPTLEQITNFTNDKSEGAYERVTIYDNNENPQVLAKHRLTDQFGKVVNDILA